MSTANLFLGARNIADPPRNGYRVYASTEFGVLLENTGCQINKKGFEIGRDKCKRQLHNVADTCGMSRGWRRLGVVVLLILVCKSEWWQDGRAADGRIRYLAAVAYVCLG